MDPSHDGTRAFAEHLMLISVFLGGLAGVAFTRLSNGVEAGVRSLWQKYRPRAIHGPGTLEAHGALTDQGEVIPSVTPSMLRPSGGSAGVRLTAGSAGWKTVGVGAATVTATAGGGHP